MAVAAPGEVFEFGLGLEQFGTGGIKMDVIA
jgi:hypothetical protein